MDFGEYLNLVHYWFLFLGWEDICPHLPQKRQSMNTHMAVMCCHLEAYVNCGCFLLLTNSFFFFLSFSWKVSPWTWSLTCLLRWLHVHWLHLYLPNCLGFKNTFHHCTAIILLSELSPHPPLIKCFLNLYVRLKNVYSDDTSDFGCLFSRQQPLLTCHPL